MAVYVVLISRSYYPCDAVVFITQDGDSALTLAASGGHTDVVVELVKVRAKLDLQNKVCSMFMLPLVL